MSLPSPFDSARFPRSSAYHSEWILSGISGGANPLWLTEWLCESLELLPGMRVLDLGCGRAMSSIFLRREFGVQVWAADLWFDAAENLARVADAGVSDGVFPISADARSLPFAREFFDVVVSIDSFMYYGTDDLYLNYLAQFLRPGGQIGIAMSGFTKEIDDAVPSHLADWWAADMPYSLHSADWWRHHWQRTGIVDISVSDILPDGWQYWLDWLKATAPTNEAEVAMVESDRGENLAYIRVIGRRRAAANLFDANIRLPANYQRRPLLRETKRAD